jgi:hypothetical protein
MATPKLTSPVAISLVAIPPVCLQAVYAGARAEITLQPISWGKKRDGFQLWQFGEDGRIYLYTPEAPAKFCVEFRNSAENGQPLQLNNADPSDQTQMWDVSGLPSIRNVGAGSYYMDSGNNHAPGNKVVIYAGGGAQKNSNEAWLPVLIPAFNFADLGSAEGGAARTAAAVS